MKKYVILVGKGVNEIEIELNEEELNFLEKISEKSLQVANKHLPSLIVVDETFFDE